MPVQPCVNCLKEQRKLWCTDSPGFGVRATGVSRIDAPLDILSEVAEFSQVVVVVAFIFYAIIVVITCQIWRAVGFINFNKNIMFKLRFNLYFFVCAIVAVGAYAVGLSVFAEGDRIPDNYIVVLHDNVSDEDAAIDGLSRAHGFSVEHKYHKALKGFSAVIQKSKLSKVKNDPRVEFVSEDRAVYADGKPDKPVNDFAQVTPSGVRRVGASGLSNKGTGVGVAVIDTGIDLSHPDLSANIASASKTCVPGTRNAKDDNGHGTHVAGTIAAVNNSSGVVGVAPEAKLFAVKVLNKNGSGTWSSVICGIDWVTSNATALGIKVANMSLGGGGTSDNNCGNTNSDAFHKAICKSVAAGVTYVVAAGNSGTSTASFVPAAYDDAVITVSALADSDGLPGGLGSTTSYGADDTFATFSNFGSAVDLGAPGVAILSTWKGGSYNTISGTSMASPHVAGAAALYLKSNPLASWTTVRDALISLGEALDAGHSDPSLFHPEKVLQAGAL